MLKLKNVGIDTYRDNVAFLARDCRLYRPEEYQAFKKIEVISAGKTLLSTLMIVDNKSLINADELGLSEQAFKRMELGEGAPVTIAPAEPPRSLDYLREKIRGHILDRRQIEDIINDISCHRYSEMEIAAFLVSSAGFIDRKSVV